MLPISEIDVLQKTSKGFYEEMWRTKDGKRIPFSEVTQQHWSNIYWYHRYLFEISEYINPPFLGVDDNDMPIFDKDFRNKFLKFIEVALVQLKFRFEGELLEWVPIYENEKQWYKKQNTRKVLIEKFW